MTDKIKKELDALSHKLWLNTKDVWTSEEVCEYTGFSRNYLYRLTSQRAIPFYKPNGKIIFFKREEIIEWMLQNRQATEAETETEAGFFTWKNNRRSA